MPVRRRRNHYHQFTEFDGSRLIGQRKEGNFLTEILQKDLVEIYPLGMTVFNSVSGKTLSQENQGQTTHGFTTGIRNTLYSHMTVDHHSAFVAEIIDFVGTKRIRNSALLIVKNISRTKKISIPSGFSDRLGGLKKKHLFAGPYVADELLVAHLCETRGSSSGIRELEDASKLHHPQPLSRGNG
ncbi:hypothetical protein TNCV_857461 [Trichonephila clavipes]|nr:hypothetical protein TNCV_857461 [Trichonephila clavipes]